MIRALLMAVAFVGCYSAQASAGGCCCPHCGCNNVKKVCKPVCDVKKETKFEYDCICEDFCVPGPSRVVGHVCKTDCKGCEHCCPVRQPTCAEVRTRTKLVKKAVTIETPTINWVVQTVCCGCGQVCGTGAGCTNGGAACADGGCTPGCAAATNEGAAATLPEPPTPPTADRVQTPAAPTSYGNEPGSLIQILTRERP